VSVEAQPFNAQMAAIRMAKLEMYFIDGAKPNQSRRFLHKNHINLSVAEGGRFS